MGIHGLSTFIQENEDLFEQNYPLRDTLLVIDAFNLYHHLTEASQKGKRTDLFGGDMVLLGSTLNDFFDNLELCKIVPILVMDGAQTYEEGKSKVKMKLTRMKRRFKNVMKVHDNGCAHYISPITVNAIFRSIAVDRGIKIYQSFYEADMVVTRLACKYDCPILSEDSDFYLVDLPRGLIPLSQFGWRKPKKQSKGRGMESSRRQAKTNHQILEEINPGYHIISRLYSRGNFRNYFPNLDTKCLPLLAPLLGNDFVDTGTYSWICNKLPAKLPQEFPNPYMNKPMKTTSIQHEKIVKVLCFCCEKTSTEVINQLSSKLTQDKRSEFRKAIKSSISNYELINLKDEFATELRKLYEDGYKQTYAKRLPAAELDGQCDKAIHLLADWLIRCAENDVMSHKIIELMKGNVIFERPSMDDLSLPSAQTCRHRVFAVIRRLLRPTTAFKKPIEIYSRVGNSIERVLLNQLHLLEKFGPIKYLAYDVPSLPLDTRRDLVLATFHCDHDTFVTGLIECDLWFDPKHGEEFMTVWMILDYIDTESSEAKLWKQFRQATLLCLVFHLCLLKPDQNFSERLEQLGDDEFAFGLSQTIRSRSLEKLPVLGKSRLYGNRSHNTRIVHQISQLQTSIDAFNSLNALLGSPLSRIRAEYWLNSCLIYNLTEALHKGLMKIPSMPGIITRATGSLSSTRLTIDRRTPTNIETNSKIIQ